MFTQNRESKEADIRKKARETISLESTLFTLTKKCFKLCAGLDKYHFDQTAKSKICYQNPQDKEYEETIQFFDACIQRCSYQYAKTFDQVRKKYIQDINETNEQNDKLYYGYYADQEQLEKLNQQQDQTNN